MEVFQAERQAHLQGSVYSNDQTVRERHNGVVMWLDEVLQGRLKQHYTAQAEQRVQQIKQANGKDKVTKPDGGTDWMAPDGLDSEQ
jgi:hypothetical protein